MLAPPGEMLCYRRHSQTEVLGKRVHNQEGVLFTMPWATTWKLQAGEGYVLKIPGRLKRTALDSVTVFAQSSV